jgi:hypothetical protein
MFLGDKTGQARIELSVKGDDTPSMTAKDRNGKPRAGLGALTNGQGLLFITDNAGKIFFKAP